MSLAVFSMTVMQRPKDTKFCILVNHIFRCGADSCDSLSHVIFACIHTMCSSECGNLLDLYDC